MVPLNHKKWFQKAFTLHYQDLVFFAQKYLYDLAESEDIVQETFVLLWENRDRIHIHTSAKSYLYAMVRNKCLNYLKTIKITDDLDNLNHLDLIGLPAELDFKEDTFSRNFDEVKNIIQVMPAGMKEIFELKYLSNFSCSEIATELNISPNTVKTQLKRAKARILQVLNCIALLASTLNF